MLSGALPPAEVARATLRRGGYIFGCGPQAALCIRVKDVLEMSAAESATETQIYPTHPSLR